MFYWLCKELFLPWCAITYPQKQSLFGQIEAMWISLHLACRAHSASQCWKIFIENIAIFVEKNIDQCATDFPVMSSVSQLRPKVWAKSRGWEREADKKLFLPQIVRYKVASVNKTVQTYQQGNFSTRHVKSLQTKLMSIIRAICYEKERCSL